MPCMGPKHRARMSRHRRSSLFPRRSDATPGRLRIAFTDRSPYGDAIDPEIAAAVREVAALLAGLGPHIAERAPALAADPAVVMATIVAANTALSVRFAEQRFGRARTTT